jgi:hypothetical protein
MMETALRVLLFLGALAMAHHHYALMGAPPSDLQKQVHELMAPVELLSSESRGCQRRC